jgi:hypothetical protein
MSTMLPLASKPAAWVLVNVPLVVARVVVFPEIVAATILLLLSEANAALEAGIAPPFTLTTEAAKVPLVVTSPLRSPLVIEAVPENFDRLPEAGDPVVVTDPAPGVGTLADMLPEPSVCHVTLVCPPGAAGVVSLKLEAIR